MKENKEGHIYEEVTVESKPVFSGKVISLQVDQVRLPDGKLASRELVRHPGAVAVLALLEGRMIVVEQYRKPLEKSLVEIPAGKLEAGEDPAEAAMRELAEETGYACDGVRHLCSFATSPGFADEILHLYTAEGLMPGEASPDEDEFLDVRMITLEEARSLMASGKIADVKTIMAVYAWQLYELTGKFSV